ncbi:MAG: hypothetical protein GC190_16550 [Alphaproteobacteria bacterium]|nr:hypothetical protein [Alphaproteobacteria bacterium]
MKRAAIILIFGTLFCVLALPAYSVSTTVTRCTAIAHQLFDDADPLDRNPPPNVATAIRKWVGIENLSSIIAVALLDRFACDGSAVDNADWTISRPVLSWQLERDFGGQRLVGLYAATARMKTGANGFNSEAKRLYGKTLRQLDEGEATCLVEQATGKWVLSRGAHLSPDVLAPCPSGIDPPPPPRDFY